MRVIAYVPMKLNNERLPNKNTRRFDNGQPLLTYIFETLLSVRGIDKVFAYCSQESIKDFLPTGVHYLTRSPNLDRSDTHINEVMRSFAEDIPADVYVLAHATAPFLSRESVEEGVLKVTQEGYDSALSVVPLQEFFWKDKRPFNYDPAIIPRTQDIEPFFAETTGLYIYHQNLILEQNRRVGIRPYLIPVSKIEAIDINEPIDFEIANAVFNLSFRRRLSYSQDDKL